MRAQDNARPRLGRGKNSPNDTVQVSWRERVGGHACLVIIAIVAALGPAKLDARNASPSEQPDGSASSSGETDWWQSGDRYPSIQLDEAAERRASAAEERVWTKALPFFAQDVIDMGFDLPHPYGVSLFYNYMRQDMLIGNLRAAVEIDAPPTDPIAPIDGVVFSNSQSRDHGPTAMVDAWLLPFMNVFVVGGYIEGQVKIDATVDLDEVFPELGGGLGTVPGRIDERYSGTHGGIGTNLVVGWDDYFAMVNLVYSIADLDVVRGVEAITASPRIGYIRKLQNGGNLALFVGAMYLQADVTVKDRARIPLEPPPRRNRG